MAFAFVENGVVQEYPVSIVQIKERFPHTSFPSSLQGVDLSDFGVATVVDTERPAFDQFTQRVEEVDPVFVDDEWRRSYSVVSLSDDETQALLNFKSESVRAERDEKLALCDWTVLTDSPLTTAKKTEWKAYRTALRDITAADGFPHTMTWPTEPS